MRPVLLIETTKTIVYFIFFFLAIFRDIRNKALSGRFLLLFLLSGIPFFLFSLLEHFFHSPFQFSKRSLLFRSCIHLVLPLPHRKKEKAAEHYFPVSSLFSPGGTLFFMAIMPSGKIRKEYHAQY